MKIIEYDEHRWQAVQRRDVNADGQFVFAVHSTGIYCRPSCPARRPTRDKVAFFPTCDTAEQNGFRACRRCHPREASTHAAMVARVCRLIETNLEEPLSLAALGKEVNMSPFQLQRIFKRTLGISPRTYADACRFRAFKHHLKTGPSATNAVYAAGYGSSSRAYERTATRLGMTPSRYRRGGEQTRIYFLIVKCVLGKMLVAATDKGICMIGFDDGASALEHSLREEFPAATFQRGHSKLQTWTRSIVRHLDGHQLRLDIPLDIQATAFQSRVWTALRSIPYGETRSYKEIAKAIGQPKAIRAVAHACASNNVSILIPCHRVVRGNGNLAGYRWGFKRKHNLLAKENLRQAKKVTA